VVVYQRHTVTISDSVFTLLYCTVLYCTVLDNNEVYFSVVYCLQLHNDSDQNYGGKD